MPRHTLTLRQIMLRHSNVHRFPCSRHPRTPFSFVRRRLPFARTRPRTTATSIPRFLHSAARSSLRTCLQSSRSRQTRHSIHRSAARPMSRPTNLHSIHRSAARPMSRTTNLNSIPRLAARSRSRPAKLASIKAMAPTQPQPQRPMLHSDAHYMTRLPRRVRIKALISSQL